MAAGGVYVISPAVFNDMNDIEKLLEALA